MAPGWPGSCADEGIEIVEVNRPNRQSRRNQGKSDPLDAIEAARAAISGRATGRQVQRRSRRGHPGPRGGQALCPTGPGQGHHPDAPSGNSAPDQLHSRLKGLTRHGTGRRGRQAPAGPVDRSGDRGHQGVAVVVGPSGPSAGSQRSPSSRRRSSRSLAATAPDLLGLFGVGPDTAATLLVAAGDNPERLHSEAAWAHLCGVSPIPADSGKNAGHLRRHQGGDRQANSALWRIVMVRIAHDPETTPTSNAG